MVASNPRIQSILNFFINAICFAAVIIEYFNSVAFSEAGYYIITILIYIMIFSCFLVMRHQHVS